LDAIGPVSSSLLPSTSFGETMWVVALRSRSNVRSHPASASPRPSGHAPGPIPSRARSTAPENRPLGPAPPFLTSPPASARPTLHRADEGL
jgi:hypothetical protein